MNCPKCGRKIPDTSPYCAYCGLGFQGVIHSLSDGQNRRKLFVTVIVVVASASLFFVGLNIITTNGKGSIPNEVLQDRR